MSKKLFALFFIILLGFFVVFAQEDDFDEFEFEDDLGEDFEDEFEFDEDFKDFEFEDDFNEDSKEDFEKKQEYMKRMKEEGKIREYKGRMDFPQYNNRGPKNYNRGPGNFEYGPPEFMMRNFDPKMMVMGKIMQGADEFLDPKDFMQMCQDIDAMIAKVIQILKEKGKFNIQAACQEFREHLSECKEKSQNMCEEIEERGATFRFNDKELTCPVSENQMYEICLNQRKEHSGPSAEEECERQWSFKSNSMQHMCENIEEECSYDRFYEQKKKEQEERCKFMLNPENNQSEEEYNRCVQQNEESIRQMWEFEQRNCEERKSSCSKDDFFSQCLSNMGEQKQRMEEEMQKQCREQASRMSSEMNKRCEETKIHLQRCKEMSQNACTQIEKTVQACESVTQQDIINLLKEHAKRMCHMYSLKEKNYYASKLLETREEIPDNLQIVYDQTAEDIVNTTQEAQDLETKITKKGIFYKLLRFIGLTKKQDLEEAKKLTQVAENLEETIDVLTSILDQVENQAAKQALEVQINKLKERKESLLELAKKRAGRTAEILESPTGAVIGFRQRKSILKEIFN